VFSYVIFTSCPWPGLCGGEGTSELDISFIFVLFLPLRSLLISWVGGVQILLLVTLWHRLRWASYIDLVGKVYLFFVLREDRAKELR
jgi:hypothetical protein